MAGALDGITVLDLSRLLPGPFCSMILADHGARVIDLEPPGHLYGGIAAPYVATLHRNKERVVLNLKDPGGKRELHNLIEQSDVFLHGFRAGAARKLGLDYESVARVRSDIIYCAITGYGSSGEGAARAGHDLNFLAETGMLELLYEGKPQVPAVQLGDLMGATHAAIAIILALFHRQRTGEGQEIDISMAQSLFSLYPIIHTLRDLGLPYRTGPGMLAGALACYNVYECSDGRYLVLGALEPKFFVNICAGIGLPELADLQFDDDKQDSLKSRLQEIFKTNTADHWVDKLPEACVSKVSTLEEAMTRLEAQGGLCTLPGDPRTYLPPIAPLTATSPSVRTSAPDETR